MTMRRRMTKRIRRRQRRRRRRATTTRERRRRRPMVISVEEGVQKRKANECSIQYLSPIKKCNDSVLSYLIFLIFFYYFHSFKKTMHESISFMSLFFNFLCSLYPFSFCYCFNAEVYCRFVFCYQTEK